MSVSSKAIVLAGLFALLPACRADCWGGYGFPECELEPYGADDREWKAAVVASNASSVFSIPGRDVSKAWPGTPMDGWTISITAVDMTPYELGTDIKIIAPESLYKPGIGTVANSSFADHGNGKVVDANSDWVFCAWYDSGPGYGYTNGTESRNPKNLESKPDGDCSQWFPEKCITAIEKLASKSYTTNYPTDVETPYGARVQCPQIEVPDECVDYGFGFTGDRWELPLQFLSGETTYQDGWSMEDEDTPAKDAPLMWKEVTRDFEIIVTMFGHYSKEEYGKGEAGFAKMSCIRPELKDKSEKSGTSGKTGDDGTSKDDKSDKSSKDDEGAATMKGVSGGMWAVALMATCWFL